MATNPTATVVSTMDPLAQTFTINEYGGVFLTRVGIKFATKSSTIPVIVQIRPTVNGAPSSTTILPGGWKQLSSSEVQTPDMSNRVDGRPAVQLKDATAADLPTTWFELEEPVYLLQNQTYAFVVLADSTEYNVYVATAGGFVLNSTERRIMKQPAAGSLFKSSNSLVWEPDQQRDMVFILEKAVFSQTAGKIRLVNADAPAYALQTNQLLTTAGDSDVYVNFKGHGFVVNDLVNIEGVETVGGLLAGSINGVRTVTSVDGKGFTVLADSAANASAIGGGSSVKIERQHMADIITPTIQSIAPIETTISYTGKFTSGKSLAGSETPYQEDASFTPIKVNANNVFNTPKLIASARNETASMAGRSSVNIEATLQSINPNISPVIDLQRTSLITVNNLVDYQQSSDSSLSNRNTPFSYVDQTTFAGDTHLAKHVTNPILLENDATGLKVFMAVNRPTAAAVDLMYRTNRSYDSADGELLSSPWNLAEPVTLLAPDDNPNVFREYEYLIGGDAGTLQTFDEFQFKIVMKSSNSAKPPVIRDFRAIALGT